MLYPNSYIMKRAWNLRMQFTINSSSLKNNVKKYAYLLIEKKNWSFRKENNYLEMRTKMHDCKNL